jgi:hypothetical protein
MLETTRFGDLWRGFKKTSQRLGKLEAQPSSRNLSVEAGSPKILTVQRDLAATGELRVRF